MIGERTVERIRDKARDYELSSLAAKERGDVAAEICFTTLALGFFELAEAIDADFEDAA